MGGKAEVGSHDRNFNLARVGFARVRSVEVFGYQVEPRLRAGVLVGICLFVGLVGSYCQPSRADSG